MAVKKKKTVAKKANGKSKSTGAPVAKKAKKQTKAKSQPKSQAKSTGTVGTYGSYGSSGYSGGGGGGGYSSSSSADSKPKRTETYTTEVSYNDDKTTTRNKGDVTTTNVTGTDEGAQRNLLANVKGTIQSLIESQEEAEDLYRRNLDANQAVADQQTLENDRNANNNWYLNQQKLQNVSSSLRSSLGNGQYGTAGRSLDYLTRTYDDMADQQLLNTQRQNQNEIYQDLYSANANAANDYNESLVGNEQEAMDQVYGYLADFNDLLGNKTVQRNRTNEKTVAETHGTTRTNTYNMSNPTENEPASRERVLGNIEPSIGTLGSGPAALPGLKNAFAQINGTSGTISSKARNGKVGTIGSGPAAIAASLQKAVGKLPAAGKGKKAAKASGSAARIVGGAASSAKGGSSPSSQSGTLGKSNSSTSNGKQTSYVTNVNKTRAESDNRVTNEATGNNRVDTSISTFASPYLDADGNLDYGKIGAALGIDLSRKTVRLGPRARPPKLQQQNNYRSPRDTVAALTRRYG